MKGAHVLAFNGGAKLLVIFILRCTYKLRGFPLVRHKNQDKPSQTPKKQSHALKSKHSLNMKTEYQE